MRHGVLWCVCWSVVGGASVFAQAPGLETAPLASPQGYVLIEEDLWVGLADEPGREMDRAREAFINVDARTAARELRKAAGFLRTAAQDSTDRTQVALRRSGQELETLAQRVEAGTVRSVQELDHVSVRALHALSDYQHTKGHRYWNQRNPSRAGQFFQASANNLERAANRTAGGVESVSQAVIRDSRLLSGKLIEGTGFVTDEVGTGFESLGRAIERLGQRIEPRR